MRFEWRGIDLPALDPRGRTASPIDAEAFFVELDHLITPTRHAIKFASIPRALRDSIGPPCVGGHLLGGAPPASDICRGVTLYDATGKPKTTGTLMICPRCPGRRGIVPQIGHAARSGTRSLILIYY
jgi:hypothetical protein